MKPPNDVSSWRPASGRAVRRANAHGYSRTSAAGWVLTILIAVPAVALWLGLVYISDGLGVSWSDLGYSVRREHRRISAGQTRTLHLRTWFPDRAGRTTAQWAVSDGEVSVTGKTSTITFTSDECSMEIFSCPVTRLGNARATVSNSEVILGVACSARELELLARVLRWRPTTS